MVFNYYHLRNLLKDRLLDFENLRIFENLLTIGFLYDLYTGFLTTLEPVFLKVACAGIEAISGAT